MPKDSFQFKQFVVRQDRCAMKVGTDGTLLGAWARGGERILDIGTGTGLIALMMAQRFPEASSIVGIDIDEAAVMQARENVAASPFAKRIIINQADVTVFLRSDSFAKDSFDSIVCNPPFFEDSLECPDGQRTLARHTSSLSYRQLMTAAYRLLSDEGELSLVIPFDCKSRMESEAALSGFFKCRECAVKTTPRKQPRRYLLAFCKRPPQSFEQTEGILEDRPNERSTWYDTLTHDFYL